MSTILEKIKQVEDEMARTQKNKATNAHLGLLKAKLAKYKRELLDPASKKSGGSGEGFDVQKTGDARIGLVGFPSVGKSTLLNKLTGTFSEVAAYEFTTLTCVPGVIHYKGSKIQLLDLPGIIEGAKDGKGRGKQVIAVAKTCSMIWVVLDAMKPLDHKKIIDRELEGFGLRLNKTPPDITIKKKEKGGTSLHPMVPQTKGLDFDTVKAVVAEYRIHNCDVILHCDASVDDLIDVIEGNRNYVPALYVLNKIDQITIEELDIMANRVPHCIPVCAYHEWNLDELLEMMWEYLDLLRIYTKPRGQVPDYSAPIVIPRKASSIEHFCSRIHKQFLSQLKYALVWGMSVKHHPQKVGKDHVLQDEDVVQLVKRI